MVLNSTKTPDDFLVQGLDEFEPSYGEVSGNMYAGLLPTDNGNRHGQMMFWLFEPDTQSVPDSIVLWLNGGPGCSSFNCGVMMEHSPVTQPLHAAGYCCLDAAPDLRFNKDRWTRATTVLYVEQPIGTGFSHGSPFPKDEHDVSGDLYAFLQNFFQVFEHLRPYGFYVMGESYAGMFVPSIAHYIHNQNLKEENSDRVIELKGAAIGNGWMDGYVQGPAVIDYSWWHGLIDKPTRDSLHNEWKNCLENKGSFQPPPFHPFNVQDDCGIMWGVLEAAGQPNAYDISTWDPNVDQVTFTSEAFYNNPIVKKALHAPEGITWHGCQQGEGRRQLMEDHRKLYMDNDRPISVVPYVADLLDAGIPVLVYNGDRDMTTNMVGTELLLNQMEWSGQDEWLNATRGLWTVDEVEGGVGGWAKELNNLTFLVVYNSGHMVPYNQPVPAFDLLKRFLLHESFLDKELPTIRIARAASSTTTSSRSSSSVTASSFQVDELVQDNSPRLTVHGDKWERFGLAAASFLAGFILCLFLVRGGRRDYRYQRVPDANIH